MIHNLNKNIKEFTYNEARFISSLSRVTIKIELLFSPHSCIKLKDKLGLASTTSLLLDDLKNELKFDYLHQNFVFFLDSSYSLLLEPLSVLLSVEMQSCSDFLGRNKVN